MQLLLTYGNWIRLVYPQAGADPKHKIWVQIYATVNLEYSYWLKFWTTNQNAKNDCSIILRWKYLYRFGSRANLKMLFLYSTISFRNFDSVLQTFPRNFVKSFKTQMWFKEYAAYLMTSFLFLISPTSGANPINNFFAWIYDMELFYAFWLATQKFQPIRMLENWRSVTFQTN